MAITLHNLKILPSLLLLLLSHPRTLKFYQHITWNFFGLVIAKLWCQYEGSLNCLPPPQHNKYFVNLFFDWSDQIIAKKKKKKKFKVKQFFAINLLLVGLDIAVLYICAS